MCASYDRDWCRDVEGQPDIVVHGPLNITLIANLWQVIFHSKPRSLKYRALSPVYVNDEYYLMHNETEIWCQGRHGNVIMSATDVL